MLQLLATSPQFAPHALARQHPPVRPATEAEGPGLGRRLPRSDRQPRPHAPAAVPGASFLDHLRRAAA